MFCDVYFKHSKIKIPIFTTYRNKRISLIFINHFLNQAFSLLIKLFKCKLYAPEIVKKKKQD